VTEDDTPAPDDRPVLHALARELPPPPHLEEVVVRRLRAAGLLRTGNRVRWVAAVAAAAILFAGGVLTGRLWTADVSPPGGERYLLLLYGAETGTPEAEASRVAEYAAWARAEAAAGRLLAGERLGSETVVLRGDAGPDVSSAAPSGFFLIRAGSRAEAEATARRCPHLRHGGTVIVTPVAE
jgi:hypothetical protein